MGAAQGLSSIQGTRTVLRREAVARDAASDRDDRVARGASIAVEQMHGGTLVHCRACTSHPSCGRAGE
eukprot:2626477-Pleurochrysis_carterae.AAC.1